MSTSRKRMLPLQEVRRHGFAARRLTHVEQRGLLARIGRTLPELRGPGHLLVRCDGNTRIVERWRRGRLIVAYSYNAGHINAAVRETS